MSRVHGRLALTCLTLAVGTILATGGLAQMDDPRNDSQAYLDAVNGGNCYSCHADAGFVAMGFTIVERYSQLPIGEPVDLTVRVRHTSKLDQRIQQISVVVNTTDAPNIRVLTDDMVNNTHDAQKILLGPDHPPFGLDFEVLEGATNLYISSRIQDTPYADPLDQVPRGELSLAVFNAADTAIKTQGNWHERSLSLSGDALRNAGTGTFRLTTLWESWNDQLQREVEAVVTVMVNYTQSQTEFIFVSDATLQKGESADIKIPVIIDSKAEGILDFRIQSVSYWTHSAGDGAPRDDGLFYRFLTMKVRGGDQPVLANQAFGSQPVGPGVDLYNLFTRILGFAAAILIPISMVTGGMFGKASRRWMNKVTGGAKKRVLWHSAMSFMIVAVATLHFLLALIEAQFAWTKGLLWGGIAWAVLISLGFTGYYQVRMIKRWNYKVWRHTHLWSAVAVAAFVVFHLVLDGSDLSGVRETMPEWHERLIWP